MSYIPEPVTRIDKYLAYIAGNMDVALPDHPITRKEHYLAAWAEKSGFEDVDVTGKPPLTLENAIGKPLKGLKLYGRSEQMRTTGAQLFTSAVIKGENSGVTLTRKDSVWHLEGTNIADGIRNIRFMEPTEHFKLPAGTYTLSFSKNGVFPIGINISISKVANPDISSEQIWTGIGNAGLNMPTKFTLDGTEEALSMFVNFPAGEFISCDLYVMLNAGDTALPWEPYTGGKPSPSPDYPQEIVSAGEDGNLNVTVRGKNLISPNIEWGKAGWAGTVKNTEGVVIANAVNGWGVFAFHSPAVGKTVTLSITYRQIETTSDDTTDAFAVVTLPSINYPKSDVLYTTRSPKTEESKINVTFTSDEYIGVLIRVSKEGAGLMRKVELRDIQLEESSKPTAYEPYHEPQSMSVTTPNGLPGIPVSSGGNYTDENGQQWICDEVDLGRGVYVQRVDKGAFDATKALTEQSVILATPIEKPLTTAEIAAYKALTTYKGTTIIDNDAGAYMSVRYEKMK